LFVGHHGLPSHSQWRYILITHLKGLDTECASSSSNSMHENSMLCLNTTPATTARFQQ
jgi:hypothetical protein